MSESLPPVTRPDPPPLDAPPPEHRVPEQRVKRPDPFALGEKPRRAAPRLDEADAVRGGATAALLAAAMLIAVSALLTALFTDLFR